MTWRLESIPRLDDRVFLHLGPPYSTGRWKVIVPADVGADLVEAHNVAVQHAVARVRSNAGDVEDAAVRVLKRVVVELARDTARRLRPGRGRRG